MKKKLIYTIGILALGIVIFNSVVQTAQTIQTNKDLIIGLTLALIGGITYGIVNLK